MHKLWIKFLALLVWPVQDKISKIMSILVLTSLKKAGYNRDQRTAIRRAAFEQMMYASWLTRELWGLGILLHYGLPTYRWWHDN